jgi:hypothetical protein
LRCDIVDLALSVPSASTNLPTLRQFSRYLKCRVAELPNAIHTFVGGIGNGNTSASSPRAKPCRTITAAYIARFSLVLTCVKPALCYQRLVAPGALT